MTRHPEWRFTPERAALHMPSATAVIADLHLDYGASRQRRGEAVPSSGLEHTLIALGKLAAREDVRRLVIAGDLFERVVVEASIDELLVGLDAARIELAAVVPGNHDRALHKLLHRLPLCPEGVNVGDWRIVHGDGPIPRGRVMHGHIHPSFRWRGVRAPCYLESATRIVVSAFSADAAGTNVLRDPRWRNYRCHVIVSECEVLDFGVVGLLRVSRRIPRGKNSV